MAPLIVLAALHVALSATPATRVDVEVFTVGLTAADSEVPRFTRQQGELTRKQNPDTRTRELAAKAAGEVVLIHSTSWRWEPDGTIVLTYVAWAKDGTIASGATALPRLAPLGPTDPLHPRPAQIRELDPLAHGLRHLAFLLRQSADGKVAAALGPRSAAMLKKLEPEVAGKLESAPAEGAGGP